MDPELVHRSLDEIRQIEGADRRRTILEEAYYEYYRLKTPNEVRHPLSAILALESEENFESSLLYSRINQFFDLDIFTYGYSLPEFLAQPREWVEYILEKATLLKAKRLKAQNEAGKEFAQQFGGLKP